MGDTTASISSDATAAQVEDALETLHSVADVDVQRINPTAFGGYTWMVTFTHDDNGADVPLIEAIYEDKLVGTSSDPYMTINSTDGNQLSGLFNISFANGTTSASVKYNASAADMTRSLESLPEIPTGTVAVSRSGPDFERGYTWTVSFLDDVNRTFEGRFQSRHPPRRVLNLFRCLRRRSDVDSGLSGIPLRRERGRRSIRAAQGHTQGSAGFECDLDVAIAG